MRALTIDIETQNVFSDVNSNDPTDLDISVVGVHDSLTDECRAYTIDNLTELWPVIERADSIITWNGEHFDIPLLNKYYPGNIANIKQIDLMKEVQNIIGRRLKLDTVAEATLGRKKIGNGLDAIEWWKNGEIEKIIKYCLEDVRLTRSLYDFAEKNGHLKYKEFGNLKEVKLDTSSWQNANDAVMTYTLPF
jgi:DEAD/DEAH box helicase domain-containing protein